MDLICLKDDLFYLFSRLGSECGGGGRVCDGGDTVLDTRWCSRPIPGSGVTPGRVLRPYMVIGKQCHARQVPYTPVLSLEPLRLIYNALTLPFMVIQPHSNVSHLDYVQASILKRKCFSTRKTFSADIVL